MFFAVLLLLYVLKKTGVYGSASLLGAAARWGVPVVAVLYALVQSPLLSPTLDEPSIPVLCASSVTQGYNRGNVSDFPGECFFADTYETARSQFISLANQVDAELFVLPIGTANTGEKEVALTTDVAVVRRSTEKVVVHVSGTHGVEGFAGSAIQAAALHQLAKQSEEARRDTTLPTLVFVHALNPYGMVFNRRVNENNIDLNRNFLSAEQWELALGRDPNFAHYVDSMDTLSPSHTPFPVPLNFLNRLRYMFLMGKVLATGKMGKLKSALLSGNYHFPKGLGFGGQGKSQSFQNLENFLKGPELGLYVPVEGGGGEERPGLKKFVLVDVHTGLGPSGVDTLSHGGIAKAEIANIDIAHFEELFPTEMSLESPGEVVGGIKSTSDQGSAVLAGYDLMMGDVDRYCREQLLMRLGVSVTASRDKVCMTQEFGTYINHVVGIALVAENHMFHYGSKELQEMYSRELKKVFYLRSQKWTRAVVHRGMEVIMQANDFVNA